MFDRESSPTGVASEWSESIFLQLLCLLIYLRVEYLFQVARRVA
jgi:hypothetical protein